MSGYNGPPFVHLHVHSNYSLCHGGNSLNALCQALKPQQDVLSLTDLNSMYGVIWARQAAEHHDLRLIVGTEITDANSRVALLARNRTGYQNMTTLITQRLAETAEGSKRSLRSSAPSGFLRRHLHQHRDGLVVLTDSPDLLQQLSREGARDLYVLCIPGPERRKLLALARRLHLPPVASNDVYFVRPRDYATHRILRAIDCNTALSRVPAQELARREAWLMPPERMHAAFPDAPEALENTVIIAEQCTFDLRKTADIFPNFAAPDGQPEAAYLETLCRQGINWRYNIDPEQPLSALPAGKRELAGKIRKRLKKELGIINMKGYASYFLVTWDIVQHASRTCGRGSAAASLVSYLLGITHVDPIRYNLYFERFLHVERKDPPDIDVDFAWDERDDILDYVFEKYGTRHTAMISNHVTFQARAALREIAKVYGLSDAEINRVSKRLVGFSIREIAETVRVHPMFQDIELYDPWPEIIRLADRISGFPRNLSVHCGGVVITPDPVKHHIPVEMAAKGVQVVQVEKDQAEEIGLVKLDILGNRSLAVIRDALAAVKKDRNIVLDFNQTSPADDAPTQKLIATGDTIGVFYVESPAMRQLQQKAKTGDFEHLVIHSSIIRPAANAFNREYIRRLHGGSYEPLHPLVEDILKESYGILCYQEDISRVAIALAKFTHAEGDALRKVFGKKNSDLELAYYQNKFFAGAEKHGISREKTLKIWSMILSFSGYSFCKPHSASYALVSYQSAYLRAHYPAEFMAAVISNQGGFYSTFAYISEAKRMGLRVLPVDINASEKVYTGSRRSIRVGFMQLKGFNSKAIDTILQEREQDGPFVSFRDFVERTALQPAMLEMLIKAGAFDSLEGMRARPQLLWHVVRKRNSAPVTPKVRALASQASLFDAAPDTVAPAAVAVASRPVARPQLKPFNLHATLHQEVETLGFLLSRHPLTLHQQALRRKNVVKAKDLRQHIGRQVRVVGWFVTAKLVRTRHDEPMEFMSFEDTTAIYEVTFFPEAYRKYCHLFIYTQPYILSGKVESDFDAISLTVHHVERVS